MSEDSDTGADAPIRTGEDEREYLLGRAEDHRRRAEMAADFGSRTIHLRFCQIYEERAQALA